MDSKLTLFSQIISKIDRGIFKKIVIACVVGRKPITEIKDLIVGTS